MRGWIVAFAFASTAACARPDPGMRAALPHPVVPEGVVRDDVTLVGGDGVQLYAQRWCGTVAPRGVLVVIHGLKDHSDRYSKLAVAAVDAGYAVYALDLRGHGRSPGPRVTIDRFDTFVDDAARLVALARTEVPGVPVFVLGHSMGGVITTRLAERGTEGLAGIMLSAPAIGLDAPAFQAAAVVALGGPGTGGFPGFEPKTELFSSRAEVIDDMARDPLIHNAKAPVHTPAQLLTAMGQAWDDAARVRVPIHIFHGTGDRLTAPAASRDFLARVGTRDRTLTRYPDAWHDLAHEHVAVQMNADVITWMDARLAGPAASPPIATGRLRGDRLGLVERHHVRGAVIIDPETGGDLDASLTFAAGRRLMLAAALEGRVALGGPAASAAWGTLGLGTRLGTSGWVVLGGGGGRLGGGWRPIAHAELAFGPRGWPIAVHLRTDGTVLAGNATVETELTARFPGNRTFWGRGRRGAGLTLGVRTVDAADAFAVVLGFDSLGFD